MVQAALNLFGSVAVAAYTTACKVEQLVTQPYMALGMTMATFSAQNRGVNDITRIRKGTRIANWFSVVYSVVIYGVIILALPFVIRLSVWCMLYSLGNDLYLPQCTAGLRLCNSTPDGWSSRAWLSSSGSICRYPADELCRCVCCECQCLGSDRNLSGNCLCAYRSEDGKLCDFPARMRSNSRPTINQQGR